jgi:hypothetical protein
MAVGAAAELDQVFAALHLRFGQARRSDRRSRNHRGHDQPWQTVRHSTPQLTRPCNTATTRASSSLVTVFSCAQHPGDVRFGKRRFVAAEIEVASWQVTVRLIFAIVGCIGAPGTLLAAVGDDNQVQAPGYIDPAPTEPFEPIPDPAITAPQPSPPAAPDIGFKQPDPLGAPDVSFKKLLQQMDSNPAAALQKKPGFTTGDTTKSSSTTSDSTTPNTTHSFTTGVQPPGPGF